ncbi:MAG: MATE family efflux transporter [Spirochaetales bacterium]|nr:MATE family efflux transporter [Spirochaetales bacterium]MBQ3697780.1 MATE family efflux transporter [Spirochaetales bacterium]MBQ6124461.1 MATE family efflux transporter [Spirochaetales bacterium]MBQ9810919.1 MATE family efflux transporter [Spirochaetales bacterium]
MQAENKLGIMPVGKLLVVMSVPTMFSMLIQAMYNIVDSIFVSHYSEKALTAVSLAFPMQMLMFSFAIGTSVGVCSVISRRLGERRLEEAQKAAQTGYTIELMLMVAFVLIGAFLSKPFIRLYTSDAELISMTSVYLQICMMLSIGSFVNVFCEKALQSTGDTIHPMIIQASGAIFNVIFDPILIFGYLGFPAMGVAGAAYATVAGQIFAMILGIVFLKRNRHLSVRLLRPRIYRDSAQDIIKVGLPAVIMQGIGTIMTSLMNAILITFDVLATTVFGVYFKLQSFVFMPIFGMNSGLMPILGYNYGAKNKPRMMRALKLGIVFAFIFMSLGTLIFNLFPDALLGLFNASDSLKSLGEVALRLISLSFPLAAISIILGALFQAMGDGFYSMVVSVVRQLFILIPCAWLFGRLFGLNAVWFSFLTAEVFALVLSLFFFRKELRKLDF